MMNNKIRTLSLSFSLPIYTRQIQNWRGAFIEMAGWQDDQFHNHDNSVAEGNPINKKKYHYRYPLIQYRVQQGKATIFAINEGVPALQQVLASNDWNINWQGKPTALQIEDLRMNEHYLRTTPQPQRYKLFKWIALTNDSFQEWDQSKSMIQRTILLQKKLENHLIGLFKGLQWDWKERVEVNLELVRKVQPMQVHGVKLLAFDIEFSTNVLLPTGIAIGKSVSHGFGWIVPHQVRHHQHAHQPITTSSLINKE
jgi:hypothetical protein